MSIKGEKGQGGNLIPVDDKGNGLPTWVRIAIWFYTGVVILSGLYLALFNPNNLLGEGEIFTWGWFNFQTYPGQPTIVQFVGTFIAAMGVMLSLSERRPTGGVPRIVSGFAIVGAAVVMTGQLLQSVGENPLALIIIGVLLSYVAPIWILVGAWIVAKWAYSWLKSRIRFGC